MLKTTVGSHAGVFGFSELSTPCTCLEYKVANRPWRLGLGNTRAAQRNGWQRAERRAGGSLRLERLV